MSVVPGYCKRDGCESPAGRTGFCESCLKGLRDIQRDLNRPVKPVKPLRRVPVQKYSEKQVDIEVRLREVYEMMDGQAMDSWGYLHCAAYPEYSSFAIPIDHSHTISRDRCKKLGHPEWIYAEWNIEHCSRKAHEEWDHYKPEFLNHANFSRRMGILKQYDPHDYDRRMEIWAAANPVKDKTI